MQQSMFLCWYVLVVDAVDVVVSAAVVLDRDINNSNVVTLQAPVTMRY